ncbi:MAG: isopeptide-forming domain-containing fimbrial protein [Eubacteriales bacterium]|nr:isopeptide-forming domain-containing fimbrial protein [Eubacteriales bacterium]
MDIDQNQALRISSGSTKMIVDDKHSTVGNNIVLGTKASSGYRKHLVDTGVPEDQLKYCFVDESFSNKDHSEAHNGNSLAVRLHFKAADEIKTGVNQFTYWFFSGRTDSSQDYGEQTGGVVMWFAQTTDAEDKPEYPNPPKVTKKVNGVESYTMTDPTETLKFSLNSSIHETVASAAKGGMMTVTQYGWTDTIEKVLEFDKSWDVKLNGISVKSKFDATFDGQKISVMMKDPSKLDEGSYECTFGAKIKDKTDPTGYVSDAGLFTVTNKGQVHFKVKDSDKPDSNDSNTVTVKWQEPSRPDPVKEVSKAHLDNADQTFTYYVTQKMPAYTYAIFGYMTKFEIVDQIDPCLKIDAKNVLIGTEKDKNDLAEHFMITVKDNKITVTAKDSGLKNDDLLYGKAAGKNIILTVKDAHYYHISDESSYESKRYKDIKSHEAALTDSTKYDHVNKEETSVVTKNNATVEITWPHWFGNWNKKLTTSTVSTDVDVPKITVPVKKVSDHNEDTVKSNTLTDSNEVWTYTIEQKIPAKTAAIYRYSSFKIMDQIDPCITIGKDIKSGSNNISDITVKIGDKTMDTMAVSVVEKDNLLTFTPSAELLKGGMDNLFYGGKDLKEQTIRITIPVHIYSGGSEGGSKASNQAKLEEIRKHSHIKSDDKGNEVSMSFKNKATTTVDDMIAVTPDTFDTEEVTTTLKIPQVDDPVKNVYDTDDLNWEREVGKMNEADVAFIKEHKAKAVQTKIRLSDSTKEYYYVVTQNIPERTTDLFFYKSFAVIDAVDSCLAYDPADVKVYFGSKSAIKDGKMKDGQDVTEHFTIEKQEDNTLKVIAKDEALMNTVFNFYGQAKHASQGVDNADTSIGNNITVVFPVHINTELDQPVDTVSGSKNASFVNTTLQKHNNHLIQNEDGTYVYDIKNGDKNSVTKTVIDNLVIATNNAEGMTTKPDERKTNEVETQFEVADPTISKEADRFEWEVGEEVKYTLTIKNKNKYSIMDRVTVTDRDLPDALQLDPSDEDAIIVYASGATENFSQPGDEKAIDKTRGPLEEVETDAITKALTSEQTWTRGAWNSEKQTEEVDITKQCEVTYFNDQGKTGNGFQVMIPKQYRGETISITFLCKVREDYNHCNYESGNCANGTVVENTAYAYASLMIANEEIKDSERIWINTPHLTIEKSTGIWEYDADKKQFVWKTENSTNYEAGDTISYSVLVKNQHPGTLARDVNVTDAIQEDGLSINKDSVEVYTVRLDDKGNVMKKYGETGFNKITDAIQVSLYGSKYLDVFFTGRNLRYYGEIPFATEIPEGVHNRAFELGSKDDEKVPGLKLVNESIYKEEYMADPYLDFNYQDMKMINRDSAQLIDMKWNGNEDRVANTWSKYPVGYQNSNITGTPSEDVWKSIRSVNHPKEWKEADVAYIVTYTATVQDGVSLSKSIRNNVTVDAENAELQDASSIITFLGAELKITKESDQKEYAVGETGHYILKVEETKQEVDAKKVVIKDALSNKDADIDYDTIKVIYYADKSKYDVDENYLAVGGEDITGKCLFPKEANKDDAFYINTGKDLSYNGMIVVTYDVKFVEAALTDSNVPNIAKAKADNAFPQIPEKTEYVPVGDAIQARKMSNPYTGQTVARGETIEYHIDVANGTDEDLTQIMVRDFIPEHATYVDGSAYVADKSGIAKAVTIDEKTAIAAVIPLIHAHETKQVYFKVTVNEDAMDDDTIDNVAEVYDSANEEIPAKTRFDADKDYPDEILALFGGAAFVMTNMTSHPLSYWAVDDNIVHIIGDVANPVKTSDKTEYLVGETIHYNVTLENANEGFEIKELALEDAFADTEYAEIKSTDTFKVLWTRDGKQKDITKEVEITLKEGGSGYDINFGRDFDYHDKVEVLYEAVAVKSTEETEKGTLVNKAVFNEKFEATAEVKIKEPENWLEVEKSSDKEIYKWTSEAMIENGTEDIAHYTVKVTNNKDGESKNVVIRDAFQLTGMQILPKTLKVTVTNSKEKDADITESCKITAEDNHYEIETGRNLGLHDYFTVTYDVIFTDVTLADKDIVNVVKATDDAGNEGEDDNKVIIKVPELTPEKSSDDHSYMVGENGHYTVKVTQDEKDVEALNVVIADELSAPVEGYHIVKESLKITDKDGKDITEEIGQNEDGIQIQDKSYVIHTHKNLKTGEFFTVEYDVAFAEPELNGTAIANIVKVKADNCPEKSADNLVGIPDGNGLTGLKTSDPVTGTSVKIPVYDEKGNVVYDENGEITFTNDEILYSITIENTTKEEKKNILVRDKIPEGSEFISSEDGQIMKIGEEDYFTAVIDSIEAGKSATVSFKIKVTAEGFALIRNQAEYKLTDPEGEPDFEEPGWTPTNKVEHPVPNVVVIRDAKLQIEKTSDKETYAVGETGKYTLVVTNVSEKVTAKNIVISDTFAEEGMVIQKDNIKVFDADGKEIPVEAQMNEKNNGFTIMTGKDLEAGKTMTVTYDVLFQAETLAGKDLKNIAVAKGDNTEKAETEHTVKIPGKDPEKDPEKKQDNPDKDPDKKTNKKNNDSKDTSEIIKAVKTGLVDNAVYFAAAGAVVLLILGIRFYRRRRRGTTIRKF